MSNIIPFLCRHHLCIPLHIYMQLFLIWVERLTICAIFGYHFLVNSHNYYRIVVVICERTSIMLLTEPDTPLRNAYHVGSFSFPLTIALHPSLAGVRPPAGHCYCQLSRHLQSFCSSLQRLLFFRSLCSSCHKLVISRSLSHAGAVPSRAVDNDIDSIRDIYIVVNVPAKAQARRKLCSRRACLFCYITAVHLIFAFLP